MRCPHCGYQNRSFDVRCYRCGEDLIDPENLPLSRNKSRPGTGGYEEEHTRRYDDYRDYDEYAGRTYDSGEPRSYRAPDDREYDRYDAPGDPETHYGDVIDWREDTSWKVKPQGRRNAADPRKPMSRSYDREPERAVTIRPEYEVVYKPGGLNEPNENLTVFDEGDAPTQRRALSRTRRQEASAGDDGRIALRTQDRSQRAGAMLTQKEQKIYANHFERSQPGRGAVKFIALSLIAACVIAGALFGAKSLADADILPVVFEGKAASDLVGPTIEQAQVDGQACHVLAFTGQEDEYIYIPELKRNYKIIQGVAKVTIKDADWIGEEPESGSVEVLLNPVLYTSGAKPKPMAPVSYTIEVPASPLTILNPAESGVVTHNSMYLLQIKVEKDSEVLIAGESVSDLINDEGIIAYNVSIEPKGDNIIPIRVKTPGFRMTTTSAVINRPYMEIPLEVSANTPVVHQSKTMTITGKVEPGAALSVKPSPKGDVSIDANGDFSFDVTLSGYGDNIIELTASMSGKKDSVITHTVNFMPKLDVYSSGAWPLSTQKQYDELIQCYTTSFNGKAFKCTGIIYEMIDANDPMKFLFNVAPAGEDPRLIVIEMVSEKTCKEGVKYDIYADVAGDYEGKPLLIGRYRMEKE